MNRKIRRLTFVLLWAILLAAFTSVTLAWAADGPAPQTASFHPKEWAPLADEIEIIVAQQAITPEINDIVGATYDPTTRQLIVIGRMVDENRPTMSYDEVKDYLLTALRSMHSTDSFPGVTIGTTPSPDPSYHLVEYFGNITDTRYGYIFFEADRLLKTYSIGRDNLNPDTTFTSDVPGYISYPDRLSALGASIPQARFFFTSSLHLQSSPITSQTIIFSNTQVILNYAIDAGETSQNRQAGEQFAAHFNANYDLFATEQFERGNSTFYELPQLFKLYGIAYWTWAVDNAAVNIDGINGGWLGNYPIITFETPVTTPVTNQGGVEGGVVALFPKTNVFRPVVAQTGAKLLEDRGNDLTLLVWESDTPGSLSCSAPSCGLARGLAFFIGSNITQDGSFENGPDTTDWVQIKGAPWDLIVDFAAHRGNYGVHLSRNLNFSDSIYQDVHIPEWATNPHFSYYWYISTGEPLMSSSGTDTLVDTSMPAPFITKNPRVTMPELPYFARQVLDLSLAPVIDVAPKTSIAAPKDFLYVQILDLNNDVLENLQIASNQNATNSWQNVSFTLDAYKGQTIRIRFRATNDAQNYTFFLLDDVSLDIADFTAPTVSNVSISPPPPLSGVTAEFEITFSEDMYKFSTPTVQMGLSAPYDTYTLTPKTGAGYTNGFLNSDPTRWYGTYTFVEGMPNGNYHLSIGEARDTWYNGSVTDTSVTFQMEILSLQNIYLPIILKND